MQVAYVAVCVINWCCDSDLNLVEEQGLVAFFFIFFSSSLGCLGGVLQLFAGLISANPNVYIYPKVDVCGSMYFRLCFIVFFLSCFDANARYCIVKIVLPFCNVYPWQHQKVLEKFQYFIPLLLYYYYYYGSEDN